MSKQIADSSNITRRSALKLAGAVGAGMALLRFAVPGSALAWEPEKVWIYPMPETNPDSIRNVQVQATFEQTEARKLLALHNEHRASIGVGALEWSNELEEIAKVRAVECAITGVLTSSSVKWTTIHDSPTSFSISNPSLYHGYGDALAAMRMYPADFLWGVDTSWIDPVYSPGMGENAGIGQKDAQRAFTGLLNSPGHRATLELNTYRSFAVACAKVGGQRFWVLLYWNKGNASGMTAPADDGTHLLDIPVFEANYDAWVDRGGFKDWGLVGEGQFGGPYTWPRPSDKPSESVEDPVEEEQPGEEEIPEPEYAPMPELDKLLYAYRSQNGWIKVKKKLGVKGIDADNFEAIAYRGTGKTKKELNGGLPVEIYTPTDGVWTVWVRCTRGDQTTEWVSLGRVNAVYEPKVVPHTALTGGRGCFTLAWKISSLATGYEVQYKKKGSSKWKTVRVGKRTSKKVSKLARGTYDVRFRPFRKKDGAVAYGRMWNEVGRVVVK